MADRLILLRHGESHTSAQGIASGDPRSTVALTVSGREQARAAGETLHAVPLDLCVTSRFVRARQTADLVQAGRDVPRLELPELDDLRFGQFEGRPLEEYRAWSRANPMTARLPGGESRVELAVRYCRAVRWLLGRPQGTILVVAHGLPLTYVVRAAEGELPQPVMRYLGYAVPSVLSSGAVTGAVERLEAWAREPAAP